jgi:hypothetical protein
MLGMFRMRWMLRMLGMFGMLRMIAILRMLLATGMVRILGWPLLTAPGQTGPGSVGMLLDLHARMLAARPWTAPRAGRVVPLIHVAK